MHIVERGEEAELTWLSRVIKAIPDVLASCKQDYKTAFIERVRDLVVANSYASNQSRELLKQIARDLPIEIVDKKSAPSTDTKDRL